LIIEKEKKKKEEWLGMWGQELKRGVG